ncbi:MAG: hypothetical protein ACNA8K_16695 [Cyclonatronaceae bacterium]
MSDGNESNPSVKTRRRLFYRVGLALLFLAIYLLLIRPFRVGVNQYIVQPVVQPDQTVTELMPDVRATGIIIDLPDDPDTGFTLYTVFGSFFLFGLIGFALLGASVKVYLILTLWHFVLFWPVLLSVRLALHTHADWLTAAMFFQNIMMHWATILAIPLLLLYQKGAFSGNKRG